MRTCRSLLALATIAMICASCSGPTDLVPTSDIVGRWAAHEQASPAGSYLRQLTFTNDDRFVSDFRSYGMYPKQRAEDLSSYTRTIGTYVVDGGRVTFSPDSLITWDSFYGADSPETVQTPYPYDSFYDDAHFLIQGETLVLDFTNYPADAPEPARQIFQREP